MHVGKLLLTVILVMVVHSEAHSYCDIEDPSTPGKPLPPLPPPSTRQRPPQPLPEPPYRRGGRPHSISSPEPLLQHNQPGNSPFVPYKQSNQPRQPEKKPATLPRPTPPTPENPNPRPPVRNKMQRSTSESCLSAKSGYDNVMQQMKGNRLPFIQEGGN